MLGMYGVAADRFTFCATPALIQDLGFYVLNERTTTTSYIFYQSVDRLKFMYIVNSVKVYT